MKYLTSYKLFESDNIQSIIELVDDELLYLRESLGYIVMVDKLKFTGPASSVGKKYGYDYTSKRDFIAISVRPLFDRETLTIPKEHINTIKTHINRASSIFISNGFKLLESNINDYGYTFLFEKRKYQPQMNTPINFIKENYKNSDIE